MYVSGVGLFHPLLGALSLIDIAICCNNMCAITPYPNCSLAKTMHTSQLLAQFV